MPQSGRFSPLRYPGGKGKIARFVADLIRENGLSDGTYIEPYAGGAAVAWELLLTGVVRRVEVNDISRPIYAFWNAVLNRTDDLCRRIADTPVNVDTWEKAKRVISCNAEVDEFELGFATFFLNRTNRSGILNGGIIGGKAQTGPWKIDARFNKDELINRIERIGSVKSRVKLTNLDAVDFLDTRKHHWGKRALVYLDPPYFVKGGQLYHDFYSHADHAVIAEHVCALRGVNWMVSYDDAPEIHSLYKGSMWLRYSIGYSAREHGAGNEAMFFSDGLRVPSVTKSMAEFARG